MMADENKISLAELDTVLQPIIDTCTKDSISHGKAWILQHVTSADAGKVISQHLLRKVTQPGAAFTQKLHIIYLVNDVLHHCARKNAEDLKKNLENVVVPMFCNASIGNIFIIMPSRSLISRTQFVVHSHQQIRLENP
ncbi:hypothetical protein JYU34_016850 [Plutella xylostella]|uniref:CID domain-containing protein n=1 Tax=Plutella xylostella TaxID=51655 RepID=A0ABQ7Q3M3_PLUXY|nr:hypothetical protein JYU34_016850 [Plutella xylostella]